MTTARDDGLLAALPPSAARDAAEHLLRSGGDPFDRSLPAHVTASAVVLDPSGRRVLLVHHGKLRLWVQPGGHIDADDASPAAAALREAHEETGVADLRLDDPLPLDLDRHPAPCLPPGAGDHLDLLFGVTAPADAEPVVSPESTDVRWFDVDALPPDAVPGLAARLATAAGRARARSR